MSRGSKFKVRTIIDNRAMTHRTAKEVKSKQFSDRADCRSRTVELTAELHRKHGSRAYRARSSRFIELHLSAFKMIIMLQLCRMNVNRETLPPSDRKHSSRWTRSERYAKPPSPWASSGKRQRISSNLATYSLSPRSVENPD